eukprot:15363419-Ditylum_brightwellii.AAC.1
MGRGLQWWWSKRIGHQSRGLQFGTFDGKGWSKGKGFLQHRPRVGMKSSWRGWNGEIPTRQST